ncbi:MAG TPA: recombinase family protein [Microvirga sp.]|nr:recombinase family protein [Microvirga sp.]
MYTRKSSEEGLEQDFNSLQAQREACEAYILSQRHEGWRALPTPYDDGGYSGGSMDRPGLTRLLADIASGQIDVVVVYKVDRLTRSLTDFARIVEVFDASQVSFVSVTQAFNTTSSMGRLTLNVLLSFAQFEREVTGERIRDKIAASKRKGLWMGGFVPIGYEASGRTLKVNEGEAETVRTIYRLYLELGSVDALKGELDRQGIGTKVRPGRDGAMAGGGPFSRGHLYRLLQNPLYIGQIAHRGEVYPGQHPALIDQDTWEAVQAGLTERGHQHRVRGRARQPSLLADLICDENGTRLTSTHAVKDGKRYRYYVRSGGGGEQERSWRVPAPEIEGLVLDQLRRSLGDEAWIGDAMISRGGSPADLRAILRRAEQHRAALLSATPQVRATLLALLHRVSIARRAVTIEIRAGALLDDVDPADETALVITVPASLQREANANRLVLPGARPAGKAPDPALIKAVARGHAWFEELASGRAPTISALAAREGVTDRYVSCLLKLAFLAPSTVERLLKGEAALSLSTKQLTLNTDLPLGWSEQVQSTASSCRAERIDSVRPGD